ncbi:MAG: hypothetical protein HRF49_08160 [bacterium]
MLSKHGMQSYLDAGKGLLSYIRDYADQTEVTRHFDTGGASPEEGQNVLNRYRILEEGFYIRTFSVLDEIAQDARCWRIYVIARQAVNALLDANRSRPILDRLLSALGIDQMERKIKIARMLLSIEDSHWNILLEAKRFWPQVAYEAPPAMDRDFIKRLFTAMLEIYIESGAAIGLQAVVSR